MSIQQNPQTDDLDTKREQRVRLREEVALALLRLQDPALSKEERQHGWKLFEALLRRYWE